MSLETVMLMSLVLSVANKPIMLSVFMPSVDMLSVILLSVVILNVIMTRVMAPSQLLIVQQTQKLYKTSIDLESVEY